MDKHTPKHRHRDCARHRHFLVAPLAVVILAASLVTIPSIEKTASVLEQPGEGTIIADGFLDMPYEELTIRALDGGIFIAGDSIAALSSPVLVSDAAGQSIIIPVGFQWTMTDLVAVDSDPLQWGATRSLAPLPRTFVAEQLADIDAIETIDPLSVPITDPSVAALLALHPQYREAARGRTYPYLASRYHLLWSVLLASLQGDGFGDGLSQAAYNRWEHTTEQALAVSTDPAPVVETVLSAHLPLLTRYGEQGYPLRRERLLRALQSVSDRYISLIDPDIAAALDDAEHEEDIVLEEVVVEDANEGEGEGEDQEEFALSPDEITATAEALVSQIGGMFLVERTHIDPLPPSLARVEQMLFGSSSGDRIVDFVLDVATTEVSRITIDGTTYPNALPLNAFGAWIRK